MGFDDGFMDQYSRRPNKVSQFQKFFQGSAAPVHLKGQKDVVMYKGLMFASVVGIGFCLYAVTQIALGKVKKADS